MDLVTASASGDRLDTLAALRDVLAVSIMAADPDKRAPLAARMTDVLGQIDVLRPANTEGDQVDEIAARRASRGSSTATG